MFESLMLDLSAHQSIHTYPSCVNELYFCVRILVCCLWVDAFLSLSKTDNLNGCVLNYSLNKSKSHLVAEYFYIYAQYDGALLLCFLSDSWIIHYSSITFESLLDNFFPLMNLNMLIYLERSCLFIQTN